MLSLTLDGPLTVLRKTSTLIPRGVTRPAVVSFHVSLSFREFTDFLVVHNGIITNYREIKEYLLKKGHVFEVNP